MDLLAELYVSEPERALAYDADSSTFGEKAQFTDFTPLELATLWVELKGGDWEEILDMFPTLLEKNDGERLIHRVPDALISDFASASNTDLQAATMAWAATEEMDCEPHEAAPIVNALADLSKKALETGRGLYIWNRI